MFDSGFSFFVWFYGLGANERCEGLGFQSQAATPPSTIYALGNYHEASLDCIVIYAFTIGQLQALPVTTDQVKTATRQDRVL